MLDAQHLALDLIRLLRPVRDRLTQRAPRLADQLERAATSVALNLAEGSGRFGRDKRRAYRVAYGEIAEVKAALAAAVAWGHVEADSVGDALALADRVARVAFALAR